MQSARLHVHFDVLNILFLVARHLPHLYPRQTVCLAKFQGWNLVDRLSQISFYGCSLV